MTKKTKQTQCMSCNFKREVRDVMEEGYKQGLSYTQITRDLREIFGVFISADAVSNHLRNHTKVKNAETLLGVVHPPKEYTQGYSMDEDCSGVLTTPPAPSEEAKDLIKSHRDILVRAGLDPEEFKIDGQAGTSVWPQRSYNKDKEEFEEVQLQSFKFKFSKKVVIAEGSEESDEKLTPILYNKFKEMAKSKRGPEVIQDKSEDRATCIHISDFQCGKVDVKGGTPELIDKMDHYLAVADDYVSRNNSDTAALFDTGDQIEGFTNTAGQQRTNDLSLMDQVDLATTILTEWVDLLSLSHKSVTVAGVPSNHARWSGADKGLIGVVGDDWGIHILNAIRRNMDKYLVGHNVDFSFPHRHTKNHAVQVLDTLVALTHGDVVSNPDKIPTWFAGQMNGGQDIAMAEIICSGHFHHGRVQQIGRSPITKRERWWLQSPSPDGGSSWYEDFSGNNADQAAGFMFIIEKEKGFNFNSLEMIK